MEDEGIDEDLLAQLKQAKTKPRNFALVSKGTHCLELIVSRKPIRDNRVVQAKKQTGGNRVHRGICLGAGGQEMVFQVSDDEPSIPLTKFKQFIADRTGLAIRPRFEVQAVTQEIDGEDEST